jgi:hypothetical protein
MVFSKRFYYYFLEFDFFHGILETGLPSFGVLEAAPFEPFDFGVFGF